MKLFTSTTLLAMLMAVVPQVQAMSCSNVCPNEDSRGCWAYWGVSNRMCQESPFCLMYSYEVLVSDLSASFRPCVSLFDRLCKPY